MTAHIPESASAWLIDAANMMPPRDPNDDDDENEQNDDVIFLMTASLLTGFTTPTGSRSHTSAPEGAKPKRGGRRC
jgi:hypothetical protein